MDNKLIMLEYLITISEFKTSYELSKILGVSTKTINRYVKDLNVLLEPYNYKIESKQGLGYGFSLTEEEKNTLQKIIKEKLMPNNKVEKDLVNLFRLVNSNASYNFFDLCHKLYTNETDLRKTIGKFNSYLSIYNLILSENDDGFYKIEGEKEDKIQATINYLQNLPRDLMPYLLENVNMKDYETIKAIFSNYLTENNLHLWDFDVELIIDLILVSLNEIRNRRFNSVNTKENIYFQFLNNLAKNLGISSFYNYSNQISEWITRYSNYESNTRLKDEIVSILLRFDSSIINKLLENKELIDQLVLHMNKFIKRSQKGIEIENPIIDDIKKQFPIEFSISYFLCKELGEKYKVNLKEDEIGFIAVYLATQKELIPYEKHSVAVICHYGVGMANLLKQKIENNFPQFEVKGIYSYTLRHVAYKLDVDFIISSVELEDCPKENIFVKDIFGDDIKKSINRTLLNKDSLRKLINLISADLMFEIEAFDNFSVIEKIGAQLCNNLMINGKVIKEVLERERISSTEIGHLVSIPHTITSEKLESFISVVKLKTPIKWGNELVQLVFLCIFNEKDKDSMMVFRSLYNFIEDKRNIEKLLSDFNYINLTNLIKRIGKGDKS